MDTRLKSAGMTRAHRHARVLVSGIHSGFLPRFAARHTPFDSTAFHSRAACVRRAVEECDSRPKTETHGAKGTRERHPPLPIPDSPSRSCQGHAEDTSVNPMEE